MIENTALCHIHWRRVQKYRREQGKPALGGEGDDELPSDICSECDPEIKKWHGEFEKTVYPLGTMYTDQFGNIQKKKNK